MEIELKFQVPASAMARLRRAVATRSASVSRLQAIYFETDDDRLSAAGLALRLRKEGRDWVQTLKGRGDGMMQRLEHELRLPARRGEPPLDLTRHDGTPVGALLREALGDGPPPQALYRTDIQRWHRVARQGSARIEVALDEGWLIAGAQRAAVCEIEFELQAGTPAALVDLAWRWAERFGLWWDVRTKAERGFRLARGRWQVPATRARASTLAAEATPREAWTAMLQAALAQALPNAAELAGPYAPVDSAQAAAAPPRAQPAAQTETRPAARSAAQPVPPIAAPAADPAAVATLTDAAAGASPVASAAVDAQQAAAVDHVHQLRVALRRLRTVLGLFATWGADPAGAALLQQGWREPFHQLGATRDADVLGGDMRAVLAAAGAPALTPRLPGEGGPGPGDIVRNPRFTALVLHTLALVVGTVPAPAPAGADPAAAPPAVDAALKPAAAAVLARAWRHVRRDLKAFASLPVERQHRTRRRLKRLRYAWEFMQPLWTGGKAKRWHKALLRALDALGHYNDLCVAAEAFAARVEDDPRAWFACGWLAAQRPLAMEVAADDLQDLIALPRPWGAAADAAKKRKKTGDARRRQLAAGAAVADPRVVGAAGTEQLAAGAARGKPRRAKPAKTAKPTKGSGATTPAKSRKSSPSRLDPPGEKTDR